MSVTIEVLLLPFLTNTVIGDKEAILRPYRLSYRTILANGATSPPLELKPSHDKVWFVHNITFGVARVLPALLPISSDQWIMNLEHNQIMKTLLAAGLESVYNFEWKQWIECNENEPLSVSITNTTGLTVEQDYSFSIYETNVENTEIIRRYLAGIFKFSYTVGSFNVEDLQQVIKEQGNLPTEVDCYHPPSGVR